MSFEDVRTTVLYQGTPSNAETVLFTATAPTEITSIKVNAKDSTGTTIIVHLRRLPASGSLPAAATTNEVYHSGTIANTTAVTEVIAANQPIPLAAGDVISAIEGSATNTLQVLVIGKVYGSA